MDSQAMVKMFKIYRQIDMCTKRIQRIVSQLGVPADEGLKFENFFDIPSKILEKVLMHLMTSECTRLLLFEEDMSVLMTPTLRLYLAHGPKVVDLTSYMSFCPMELKYETFKSAVMKISETAAHTVEELLLLTKASRQCECRFPDNAVDPELFEALGKLTQLKVLRLEELCYFEDLDVMCHLCEKLPNLQFLSINFPQGVDAIDFEENKVAEKLMSYISNLKVFIFNASVCHCDFRRLCMDCLPNLQVVENFANESFPHNYDWKSNNSIPDNVCREISKLRHLLVDFGYQDSEYGVTSEDMHLKFPFVTHLWIFWYEEDSPITEYQWQRLLHFPLIESLDLENKLPPEILNRFLDTYGKNLLSLSISDDKRSEDPHLTLTRIFTSCPKLETLSLRTTLNDPEAITNFSNLKEVELTLWLRSESRNELCNILRAPNLEKVTLHCQYMDVEDLKKLTTLISTNEVLRHLKMLKIELRSNFVGQFNENSRVERFKEVMELVKRAATASLPELKSVKFCLNHRRSEYSTLARSLRDGKTINEDRPDVTDFFSDLQQVDDVDELISWFVDEQLISLLDSYNKI